MAVVSLSKIQIRRGRGNNQSTLPNKLASGELAWAIDDQQLWIGRGTTAEGAPPETPIAGQPLTGRTRILTENDNIFDVGGGYLYKANANGAALTGVVERTLQARLDDTVSLNAFGGKLQTAITQLFSTTVAKAVILYIDPGIYNLNETIVLPPNTRIQGAGIGRTIFNVATDGPAFATADSATNIWISGFTVNHTANAGTGLQLNGCKNSHFSFIELNGMWTADSAVTESIGIELITKNNIRTENNTFESMVFSGQTYDVFSAYKTINNMWTNCRFEDSLVGVKFDTGIPLSKTIYLSSEQRYDAPQANTFCYSMFKNISQHAILVARGSGNISRNNTFYNVGNVDNVPEYPVIEFVQDGNTSDGDWFERTGFMNDPARFENFTYPPEVKGPGIYHNKFSSYINLAATAGTMPTKIFSVPAGNNASIEIEYTYKHSDPDGFRKGTLNIITGTENINDGTPLISDQYEFIGAAGANVLSFTVDRNAQNAVDTLGILMLHLYNDADFYYTIKATS